MTPPSGAAEPGPLVTVGIGVSVRTPRSGLIAVQCTPPSVVPHRDCNPAMRRWGFHGANFIGASLPDRSFLDGSTAGLTLIHVSFGYVIFTMPLPEEYTMLGFNGSGAMLPHSQPGTGLQSSGVISPRLPRARVRISPASCW